MALVAAERITVFPGPPTIYQTILDHPDRAALDLSSLRLAVTGAATVPVALVERMQRELSFETVLTAYGLTEAVVATMCRPGDDPERVASTSGRAAAGFEVRIAGPDGAPRPAGEAGEILLRGPNVMLGYLDDPAATREAIDPGGWLHTGDVGHLDPDGYLTITDRLKDMYICGGFNVYPAEVEQVLARLDGRGRGGGGRGTRRPAGRGGPGLPGAQARLHPGRRGRAGLVPAAGWPTTSCPARWCSATACRATRPARPSSDCCGRSQRDRARDPRPLRGARAHRADHPQPAALPQRAELGDDLRAGRGLRPGRERPVRSR